MTPGFVAGLARSEATVPFWEGLASGELRLPRCQRCDERFFFPRRWCPLCWSTDLGWEQVRGGGEIYAVTTVHVPFDPSRQVPMSVALVELDEGVLLTAVLDPPDGSFAVGDRVEIAFLGDPAADLPVFRRPSPEAGR
jgi:uncharacterized protein